MVAVSGDGSPGIRRSRFERDGWVHWGYGITCDRAWKTKRPQVGNHRRVAGPWPGLALAREEAPAELNKTATGVEHAHGRQRTERRSYRTGRGALNDSTTTTAAVLKRLALNAVADIE